MVVSYFAMQSVALVTEYAKGRARHIPPQTDTVVRFAPEHVVLFLHLCDLGTKGTPQRLLLVKAFLREDNNCFSSYTI